MSHHHHHHQFSTEDYVNSEEQFNTILLQLAEQQQPKSTPTLNIIIKSLPITKSGSGSGSFCPICKDEFNNESVINYLPCTHLFHSDCIVPWLSFKNTCPLCRFLLPVKRDRSRRKRRRDFSGELFFNTDCECGYNLRRRTRQKCVEAKYSMVLRSRTVKSYGEL